MKLERGNQAFYSVLLAFGVLTSSSALGQPNASLARLAIIAAPDVPASLSDLLTVELSRRPGFQLLEREQIEKAYREQGLSAANRDFLKLGQLLGADGLLLLGHGREAANEFLEVQLIAVKPGVLLKSDRFSWGLEASPEWASGVASRLIPLLPKLKVLVQDAVPVSVVHLRSAIESATSRELERQLTLLTLERLSRERQLFVLERRRMQLLSAEKEMTGLDDGAFWGGGYLLEGTVDRQGYSPEKATITGRLIPPRGGTPIEFEISGSRTNLTEVVNRLVETILARLKLRASAGSWTPADEAGKYFEEAKWAYRWGLLSDASEACEASWALGKQTKDVAALRILAGYEDGVDRAQGWYDVTRKLVTFAPSVRPVPGEVIRPYEPVPGCSVPPDGARFGRVRRAMELYCRDFRNFIMPDPNPGWEWHDLGLDLLEGASFWLRHYYYAAEARVGQAHEIASVQALARETASLIGGHAAYTNDFGRRNYFSSKANWGFPLAVPTERTPATLLGTKLNWGAYWFATPEEGVALYRDIVNSGSMPKVRRLFLNPDFLETRAAYQAITPGAGGTLPGPRVLSYLTGWKWPDRQRALGVWHRFLDELCASTHSPTQAEGLFLRCAQAPGAELHARAFRELMAFLEAHQEELAAHGLSESLAADLDALIESRRSGLASADAALDEHKQSAKRFQLAVVESKGRLARAAKLSVFKDYLAGSAYDFAGFNQLFFQFDYQADEARALLPLLDRYRSNVTAQAEAQPLTRGKLSSLGRNVKRLEDLLNSKLQPAAPPLLNSASAAAGPGAQPPPAPRTSASPFANAPRLPGRSEPIGQPPTPVSTAAKLPPLTNPLPVTRFWRLPDRLPQAPTNEPSQLSLVSCCFREGRLWVDARAIRIGTFVGEETYFNRGAIFSVNLDSFQSEAVTLDPRSFSLPKGNLAGRAERMFEVNNGWLYVSSKDSIKRYALTERKWEELPVPVQGHARIVFVDDRMLLSNEDSILESTPDGKAVRILASSRRQPPETILDSVQGYDTAPIIKGPEGSLITFIAGKFYELPRAGKEWKPLPSAPELPRAIRLVFDSGLILTSRLQPQDEQMFALLTGSRSPELLLVRAPQFSSPPGGLPRSPASQHEAPLRPRWQLPVNMGAREQSICLDGETLWALSGLFNSTAGGSRPVRGPESGGQDDVLFCLQRDQAEPLAIALRLEPPETPAGLPRFGGPGRGPSFLEATPKGLIVASARPPGFWLIPRSELDERRKAWLAQKRHDAQTRDTR